MSKIATTFLLILLALNLGAQDAPNINLLLTQTTLGKGISYSSRDRIDRQILSALGGDGVNNQFSIFVVQPALDILEEGKIEGVKAQKTVKLKLQLKLSNSLSGEVMGMQDVNASGAGNTLDEAINRAVQSIRRDNPGLTKSLAKFRERIAEYYATQCGAVGTIADEFAAQKKYPEAFATLHAIPQGTPCYEELATKKMAYFTALQTNSCENKMARANAAVAADNFTSALAILSEIDASAPCFAEAKAAVSALESKVDADQQKRYEWLFSFYREGKAAETAQWNAMTALCLAWLRDGGKYKLIEK